MSFQQLIITDVAAYTAFWFVAWVAISRRLFRGDFPLWMVPLMGTLGAIALSCERIAGAP